MSVKRNGFKDGFHAKSQKGAFLNGYVDQMGSDQYDDQLKGTEPSALIDGADTMNGLGGDDVMIGYGGNDTMNGGDGKDSVNGGTGADTLRGGAGNDTIDAGSMWVDDLDDTLVDGEDDDLIENEDGDGDGDVGQVGVVDSNEIKTDADRDTIVAEATFEANGIDTIHFYDAPEAGEGDVSDVIDLRDVFVLNTSEGGTLADYVSYDALTGELWIDADGAGDGAAAVWFNVFSDAGGTAAAGVAVQVNAFDGMTTTATEFIL